MRPFSLFAGLAVAALVGWAATAGLVRLADAAEPWDQDARDVLSFLCNAVNADHLGHEEFCECLVEESARRIDRDAFMEWVQSEGTLRRDEVVPKGNEAEAACVERMKREFL